ncbi:FAD-binding oxidoreductase [Actinomadura craniellae]|uniref:FAD-binding oxidoreductase n=1 Tax=Actinomadura craniellae TaxID=2231787 RepID=A0A365GZ43_9ACTN|nr:FAD-binding oxidoreductase [Actinomadura craniellae]RAY12038.1 FAD-binding oxidoreductase [Actinomadura craniellae]
MNVQEALEKACPDVRSGAAADAVLGVRPRWVASPGTVAEAAGTLRAAAAHGLAVVPRGAGTRLGWGAPPRECDLVVDTRRLDRVIEHAAGDLVVTVEAGLPVDRLAEVLAGQGQRLALDRPLAGSTVGGTLATGAAGPLRLLYGGPRDLVIGITVVRADGEVARSGGKVVKNVAGYDLGRLFTGSFGTLGLIVAASFRLHPLPAARAYVTARVDDPHPAVQAVLHSAAVPAAVEIHAPPGGPYAVGVLVEGVAAGIAARAEQVARLLGPAAEVGDEPPAWWNRPPAAADDLLLELTLPPAALPGVLAAAGEAGAEVGGSAGTGRLHARLPASAAAAVPELRDRLAPLDAGLVVRAAPPGLHAGLDLWGPVPALRLMRRVKDQFDPGHRMSPGRFAGGI